LGERRCGRERNEGDIMENRTIEQVKSDLNYNLAVLHAREQECEKLEIGFDLLRDVLAAGIADAALKEKVEQYINSMLSNN